MKELINNLEYVETLTKEGREKLKQYVKDLEENNKSLQESLDMAMSNWLGLSSKIGEMRGNIQDRIIVIITTYLGENSTRYSESVITEMTARKQTYENILMMLDKLVDNE